VNEEQQEHLESIFLSRQKKERRTRHDLKEDSRIEFFLYFSMHKKEKEEVKKTNAIIKKTTQIQR